MKTCTECGQEMERVQRTTKFNYGQHDQIVELSADIPVWECPCGEIETDHVAGEIREKAIRNHIGILTPAEIRARRHNLGLSQKRLAEFVGVTEKRIQQLEDGIFRPSFTVDAVLRLLCLPGAISFLEKLNYCVTCMNTKELEVACSQCGGLGCGECGDSGKEKTQCPRCALKAELRKELYCI